MFAAFRRQQDTVDALLRAGADVNAPVSRVASSIGLRGTVLTFALEGSAGTHLIGDLLAHGADPNLPDIPDSRPLDIAARTAPLSIVRMLLSRGAKSARRQALNALENATAKSHPG